MLRQHLDGTSTRDIIPRIGEPRPLENCNVLSVPIESVLAGDDLCEEQPGRVRSNTNCRIAYSSALRTWTTFTSKQGRFASSTCTANSSRAVATGAADRHFVTPTPTIRQPSFPGANAAVGFARTSVGSAKCRSNWIASSTHWTNARFYSCWYVGGGRASGELRRSRRRSCPNDLRRSRRTRKRIRVHGMPSGESRGGFARPTRSKVCVVKPILQLRVLGFGFLQSQNQTGLRRFRDGERRASCAVTNL